MRLTRIYINIVRLTHTSVITARLTHTSVITARLTHTSVITARLTHSYMHGGYRLGGSLAFTYYECEAHSHLSCH